MWGYIGFRELSLSPLILTVWRQEETWYGTEDNNFSNMYAHRFSNVKAPRYMESSSQLKTPWVVRRKLIGLSIVQVCTSLNRMDMMNCAC